MPTPLCRLLLSPLLSSFEPSLESILDALDLELFSSFAEDRIGLLLGRCVSDSYSYSRHLELRSDRAASRQLPDSEPRIE